jgi:hypothetical protein
MISYRKPIMLMLMVIVVFASAAGTAAQDIAGPVPLDSPAQVTVGPAAGWRILEVDRSTAVGDYTAMAIEPTTFQHHIAYHRDSGGVKMATGPEIGYTTCTAANWDCGLFTSQEGNHVAISYPAPGTWAVVYQQGNQPWVYTNCPSPCFGTSQAVDFEVFGVLGAGNAITHDSLGTIHLSYTRSSPTPSTLRYAKYVGTGGNCFNNNYPKFNCEFIDGNIGSGANTSIDTSYYNLPSIAYRGPNGELMLASKLTNLTGNCGPSNSWRCIVIDSSVDIGNYIDLHVPKCFLVCNDAMQIAYMNKTTGILRYARNVGSGGNCGSGGSWECTSISSIGFDPVGMGISLKVYNGQPLIAYMDHDDTGHDVLKLTRPVGSGGNCAFSTWLCTTIDDGYRGMSSGQPVYHNVGRYASLALYPSGDASIAYQDHTSRYLVLAEEVNALYLPAIGK